MNSKKEVIWNAWVCISFFDFSLLDLFYMSLEYTLIYSYYDKVIKRLSSVYIIAAIDSEYWVMIYLVVYRSKNLINI